MSTAQDQKELAKGRRVTFFLVLFLIAIFAIPTAALQCTDQGGGAIPFGGEFDATPTQRAQVSDEEFSRIYDLKRRVGASTGIGPGGTIKYYGIGEYSDDQPYRSTWAHLLAFKAAEASGYRVGRGMVDDTIRQIIPGVSYDEVALNRFLTSRFRGTIVDFREGMRHILLKDLWLSPLVDAQRYSLTREAAYDTWKHQAEHVDLRWFALDGAQFEEATRLHERSRAAISRQEDLLSQLRTAARELNRVHLALERWKSQNPDADWPEDLAWFTRRGPDGTGPVLTGAAADMLPQDTWGEDLQYTLGEDGPVLSSKGPDREAGTPDDIGVELFDVLNTQRQVFELAYRATQWRNASDGAWPPSLAALGEPLPERPALLPKPLKDAWERELEYIPAADGGAPRVRSLGADGIADTADDISAVLTADEDEPVVEPAAPLSPWILTDNLDGYGRPVRVQVKNTPTIEWSVKSAGEDGQFGTDDDITSGNMRQIEAYYGRREIRSEYKEKPKRSFELLYSVLPLLPDEVFRKMWNHEAYAEFQPTDEEAIYKSWVNARDTGIIYTAENPADPESGHGAEVARMHVENPGPLFLVPDRSIFPEPADAPLTDDAWAERIAALDAEGTTPQAAWELLISLEEAGKRDLAKQVAMRIVELDPDWARARRYLGFVREGDEWVETEEELEGDAEVAAARDTYDKRKAWSEDGWREILLRERFMDALLTDLLTRLRARHDEQRAWDEKHPEPTDEERAERPADLTFELLLAGELRQFDVSAAQSAQGYGTFWYMQTEGQLTNDEIADQLDKLGGINLWVGLSAVERAGDYGRSVIQGHNRTTKVIPRILEVTDERTPDLDEVYDRVFDAWLPTRSVERAADALEELKTAIEAAESAEGGEEPAPDAWREAVATFETERGVSVYTDTTGMFVGRESPRDLPVPEGADETTKREIQSRNFVWASGYGVVSRVDSLQDQTGDVAPGLFGRNVLRDPDGGRAFLIRVAEHAFPVREAMGPKEYLAQLAEHAMGGFMQRRGGAPLRQMSGRVARALQQFIDEPASMMNRMKVETNTPYEELVLILNQARR